jgi:putative DNA primase/helicase
MNSCITLDKVFDSTSTSGQPKKEASLDVLANAIKIGNRDKGAFEYINAVIKQHGALADDDALAEDVINLLKKAGGPDLEDIIKKVPGWIVSAHKHFDGHYKRTPLQLAEKLIEDADGHIKYLGEQFHIYQNGHWPAVDERVYVRRRIAKLDRPYTRAARTRDACETLKNLTAAPDVPTNQGLICLQNGVLDPQSGQLLSHSPSHGLPNALPITWDSAATCPLWLQTLKEIFEGDPDAGDKITLLQLWFGYCLIPDTSHHKFLWLVGTGANGKSLILDILCTLIGPENVSHAMITRLDRAFVRAELQGKLVNISAEMKAEDTISDGYLKAIVAGDRTEAEQKYKPSFSFRPYARIVAATNELPRLLDLSEGFRRRAIILQFNRTFAEKDQDKHRANKLQNELAGILVWAVDGLRKLRELGRFPIPASSDAAILEYIKDSNPVRQFVEEALIETENGSLTTTTVYWRYRDWARERGYQKMNVVTFGKRMKALGLKRRHTNGKHVWCVKFSKCWEGPLSEGELPDWLHVD